MFSIIPGIVACYFLIIGSLVWVKAKQHSARIAFSLLCLATFVWQMTWAILFQVDDPELANILIKFGYLLVIFLPTSLYHFLVEVSQTHPERKYVYISYVVCSFLALTLLFSDLFVVGYYEYYWGYYPKAGVIHPVHVLQTVVVVMRGLYIAYEKQKTVTDPLKEQLKYCVGSLFIYLGAAIDYACNYGIEFYPPGIIFIATSLSVLAYALLKKDLLNIQLVITRMGAHAIIAMLIVITFVVINILPETNNGFHLVMNIVAALLWAKYGNYLRERLQTTTERKWVTDWYDPNHITKLIARRLPILLNRKEIISSVIETLEEVIAIKQTHALIRDDTGYLYYNDQKEINMVVPKEHPLISHLQARPYAAILFSDLPAPIKRDNSLGFSENSVLLPLHSSGGLEGVIVLSERVSEARYSRQDRHFLETVARQVNVFLDKAEAAAQHEERILLTKSIAGTIAHELRTPITTINMAAKAIEMNWPAIWQGYELGKQHFDGLEDKTITPLSHHREQGLRKGIESINRASRSAHTIITMLMENVRNEQVNTADFKIYSISHCVQKALVDYPYKNGEVEQIQFDDNNDFEFKGSDSLLIYLLYNLIKNAFYYLTRTGAHGIRIWLERGGEINTLHFKDNGSGIEEEVIHNIFDPFFTTKPVGIGNGLGLSFCRRVIESFGGNIQCNSIVGEYTEFLINFPRVDEMNNTK